ncbi:hypothetical protein KSP40_PGU001735 [Platanthera guangdongensis]|uniref:Uncharacterized protein n=1 Tax=Platanthera guangdongensis TaxID=2320717 RepID=A0ABR2M4S8_9ASPA
MLYILSTKLCTIHIIVALIALAQRFALCLYNREHHQGHVSYELSLIRIKGSPFSPAVGHDVARARPSRLPKVTTPAAIATLPPVIPPAAAAALLVPSTSATASSPLLHTEIPDSHTADFTDSENLTDAQNHEQRLSTDEDINRMIEELTSKEPLSPIPADHPSSPAKSPEQPDHHPEPSPQRSSPVQDPTPSPSENAPDAEVVSIHDSEDEIEAAEPPLTRLHFKIPYFLPIDAEDEDNTVNKKKASTFSVVLEEISQWTAHAHSEDAKRYMEEKIDDAFAEIAL